MSPRKSRLVVIDASVAQAAGETDHPTSKSCRETLLEIKRVCDRIVMTPAIRDEWGKHASRFSLRWRHSMTARRKVKNVNVPRLKLETTHVPSLNYKERESLQKDALLIEGAYEGDGIIISLDDHTAKIWDKCYKHFQLQKKIEWINPRKLDSLASSFEERLDSAS